MYQTARQDFVSARIDRRQLLKGTAAGAVGFWLSTYLGQSAFGQADSSGADLIFHQRDPLNAEPPLGALPRDFITPNKNFYIRNHGDIPAIDPKSFQLKVEGLVETPGAFSLDELQKRFPKAECIATMTCAGNRRREHNAFQQVSGVQWDAGAIGNAKWTGIKLSDLLQHCGLKEGAAHIWFDGMDLVKAGAGMTNFGGSIPLEKAMQNDEASPGALLSWAMNDAELSAEHGRPLRGVVPGYIGARSVKWLNRIVVSDRPSPNHYVQSAYKVVTKDEDIFKAEQNPIYRFPMNIAICDPAPQAKVSAGMTTVRGYALPTGVPDAKIREVEISTNGGRRWTKARLLDEHTPFCWTRWEADVPITERTSLLIARAADTTGGVTPDRANWNLHGYLYNGWHSVPVSVSG